MSLHRITWSRPSSASESAPSSRRGLAERLGESARDRATDAVSTVLEAARILRPWVREHPARWSLDQAGRELEEGWAEWVAGQGWRGVPAIFVDTLRCTLSHPDAAPDRRGPRGVLLEELDAWLRPRAEVLTGGAATRWDGSPLTAGSRFARREDVAPHAVETLGRGEWILVHGYSQTVLSALSHARQKGLFPRALVSESSSDHGGRRMARELARAGVGVRLTWDAAALSAVNEVDRLWLGTEAIGAGVFIGPVGTGLLLKEASRNEVPAAVLCTGDELIPGGEASLPAWGEEETWNLWSQGPEGVELASQPFERVNADLVDTWLTDSGREELGELCLRAMRPVAADPCAG